MMSKKANFFWRQVDKSIQGHINNLSLSPAETKL